MARRVRLWRGERPADPAALRRRAQRALRIVRREGFREVRDPWGDRVRVQLSRVVSHIGYPDQEPDRPPGTPADVTRWRLIPLIVPAIKEAQERYGRQDQAGRPARRYLATLPVPTRRAADTLFVVDATQYGEHWICSRILRRITPGERRNARKTAGRLEQTRRNPHGALVAPWDRAPEAPAAPRLPGARPALTHKSMAGRPPPSSAGPPGPRWGHAALLLAGALVLAGLAQRPAAPAPAGGG